MSLTGWFLSAIAGLMIGFTAVARQWFNTPTISMFMRDNGWLLNMLPYTIGLVIGHWFFPRREVTFHAWALYLPILAGIGIYDYVIAHGHLILPPSLHAWLRYPGFWFLLGIPTGMILWTQKYAGSPIP